MYHNFITIFQDWRVSRVSRGMIKIGLKSRCFLFKKIMLFHSIHHHWLLNCCYLSKMRLLVVLYYCQVTTTNVNQSFEKVFSESWFISLHLNINTNGWLDGLFINKIVIPFTLGVENRDWRAPLDVFLACYIFIISMVAWFSKESWRVSKGIQGVKG